VYLYPAMLTNGRRCLSWLSAKPVGLREPTDLLKCSWELHCKFGSVHSEVAMENRIAPFLHWHVHCAACSRVTLARACNVPGEIKPIEHNPVIRCQHCGETRQYLDSACFLTPLSTAASPEKSTGALAVVAGLIAAVKLARVESREIQIRSPRVRYIISESITTARMVIEASRAKE
jgi:hypothetical protein